MCNERVYIKDVKYIYYDNMDNVCNIWVFTFQFYRGMHRKLYWYAFRYEFRRVRIFAYPAAFLKKNRRVLYGTVRYGTQKIYDLVRTVRFF